MSDPGSLLVFRDKGHAACVAIQLFKDIFSQVSVTEEEYLFLYEFLQSTMEYYFDFYHENRFHLDIDDPSYKIPF